MTALPFEDNLTPLPRKCRTCGETKSIDDFYFADRAKGLRLRQCKACHTREGMERRRSRYTPEQLRAAQREYNARRDPMDRWNNYLRSRYGLTVEGYHALLEAQNHACAICETPLAELTYENRRALHVDHCHDTGRVRGLLCNACNRSIGGLRDDPALLRRAADYLEASGVPLAQQHPEWRARFQFLNRETGPKRSPT